MLDFFFTSQAHKNRDGYFLNHDNLMVATPEQRQRMIMYFIGTQVPEKLSPVDRSTFVNLQRDEVAAKSNYVGILLALRFAFSFTRKQIGTRVNPRLFLNGCVGLGGSLFYWWLGQNLTYNVIEPRFITNNEELGRMAKQYNFSVYDFHQAKKESHIKSLRSELISDQLLTGY